MVFKFSKFKIPGPLLVESEKFTDDRGTFMERYRYSTFKASEIDVEFLQDSYSVSKNNVLRGMHYQQEPMAQGKLVGVLSGKIFDVAIDIRRGSPTFGEWIGEKLSAQNCKMLWIPSGFAHGFLALEDNTIVVYKTTAEYSKQHERGIVWNDKDIGIDWPRKKPIISERDSKFPILKDVENDLVIDI